MKKITIAVAFLITLLLVTYFIPVTEKKELLIASPILRISEQLIHAEKWKKWNIDLKSEAEKNNNKCTILNDFKQHSFTISTPHQSISVISPSGTRFEVSEKRNGASNNYIVSLSADIDNKKTIVTTEKKNSLFTKLFWAGKNKLPDDNILYPLKKFMETDSLYYGFAIEIKKVVDSIVIVLNRQIPLDQKFLVTPSMLKTLHDYTAVKKISINQPLILQYIGLPNDSISVLTMLSVNKKVPDKDKIRCMKMPVKGRMLVGYFKGKFKDRIQLQVAMQQYILDNNLNSIVGSYEKYLNNKLPESENDAIEIEMYYPIL
ncbi:MAG: hypothetical protein ABIO56_18960 [Ferruginibacter sp.]